MFKCTLCGRNKFDRKNQPHNCNDGFRKHFPEGSFDGRVLKNADALIESGKWEKLVKEVFK